MEVRIFNCSHCQRIRCFDVSPIPVRKHRILKSLKHRFHYLLFHLCHFCFFTPPPCTYIFLTFMCRFLQKGKPASRPALYQACFGCFVASACMSEWCEFHEFPIHRLYLFFHQGICLFIELSEVLFCFVLFNSEGIILLHLSQSSGVKQHWVWTLAFPLLSGGISGSLHDFSENELLLLWELNETTLTGTK